MNQIDTRQRVDVIVNVATRLTLTTVNLKLH